MKLWEPVAAVVVAAGAEQLSFCTRPASLLRLEQV